MDVSVDFTNPQTINRYVYCRNNPLRYIDPDGREEIEWYEYELIQVGLFRDLYSDFFQRWFTSFKILIMSSSGISP